MNALFVGVDGGAQATLRPLAALCGATLENGAAPDAETGAAWAERARAHERLVVGTSESARGQAIEAAARRAFRAAGKPIAAIEDFPGNYRALPGGEADLVVVESDAARAILLARDAPSPAIRVIPSARYDGYRARLTALRKATARGWAAAASSGGPTTALWAGQPETDDALTTLAVLLPALAELRCTLLFKAHPDDAGYAAGAYRGFFQRLDVAIVDCTASSTDEALALAPRLVVTQFSSLALEAGFFGIPGLSVLLPDAGAARLREKKGYALPPACVSGALDYALKARDVPAALDRLLRDDARRSAVLERFDRCFDVTRPAAPRLVEVLCAWGATP